MNRPRHMIAILREIARERGLEFQSLSQDWIVRLAKQQRTRWIFGYDFDLNSCCAQQLCKDKAGSSLLLGLANVSRVEHVLFNHPQNRSFVSESGTWSPIHSFAAQFGFDVVCKPNDGSGGAEVTRTTTVAELEEAAQRLFSRVRAIALSPFVEIVGEYRTVILQGKCLLAYRKVRPNVIGDGRSSRLELIARALRATGDEVAVARTVSELSRQKSDLNIIVPKGEVWNVNWKHNLGLGAQVELLDGPSAIRSVLETLAIRAAGTLDLTFGSVDIVDTGPAGGLKVLELNAGVMMESFITLVPEGRIRAANIYGAAVDAMFA